MDAALHLAAAEPELERHLPEDGFRLVPPSDRFDLVLAADVDDVDEWARRAPVIVLGAMEADVVDRVHAFRKGCDDYVPRPFDYQELVGCHFRFQGCRRFRLIGHFAGVLRFLELPRSHS